MSVSEKGHATPDGILKIPGLSTALAWDNYDEMNETLSGSGTLHDTVGICYQNISTESACNVSREMTNDDRKKGKLRSRTFDSSDIPELEPYRKKPKISEFSYSLKTTDPPDNLQNCKRRDILWTVMSNQFAQIPMWTGWNSIFENDPLPQQTIAYMENITLPPTRLDVVAETLRVSQKVAEECQEDYAIVTYDLAIAKPAKQIQQAESPRFDNIFICFGPFHIQLAFFGSLGHILDESGGPHILTDTEVLGSGSLSGFISGKHFNRCKRLHPMLYQAFKILHLRAFLHEISAFKPEMIRAMEQLRETRSTEALDQLEDSAEYSEFMCSYEDFTQKTRNGEHGKTAQYWMMYMDLVQLYLLFSRACHTNDIKLFTYCLGEMVKVFFATNRPNYARWMFRYHLDLINIDQTHPGIRPKLEKGAFTIRRTSKMFSRSPVDLVLEQSINADAASRLTGISSFSTKEGARRRWMLTQTSRRTIVNSLLTKSGMISYDSPAQELKQSRIERDNNDLQKLVSGIETRMNPFSSDYRNDELICISTGKIVSKDIADDLLTMEKQGSAWMEQFASGCFLDSSRFEKPIPRRKVKNFADCAIKMAVTRKDNTIRQLTCSRDLFGRLLYLATTIEIDLKKIFSFPLTPVPLSLAHVDGSVMKTDKSKLMKILEDRITSEPPQRIDATIIDGMFLIQTMTALPSTFAEIAKVIISRLSGLSSRVDFVCDTYRHPSIKDIERTSRSAVVGGFIVSGRDQRRPKEFHKALRSESFKTSFLVFLSEEWARNEYAPFLKDRCLYFGLEDKCYRFTSDQETVSRIEIGDLACKHEEADTRIIWHLHHIAQHTEDSQNVVIRCSDTDVLVILLNYAGKYSLNVWMDVGLSSSNNRRYIEVNKLGSVLGQSICDALPAVHAFTGCDYTAAFVRKGKVRPFSLVEKSTLFQKAFAALGESQEVTPETESTIESFVCAMYGKPGLCDVESVRYSIFRTKFAPTDEAQPLGKIKGADATLLPPSKPVLHQKLLRTNLVSYIWRHAHKAVPLELDPTENGWLEDDGYFKLKWFSGPQLPTDIERVLSESVDEPDDTDEVELEIDDIDGDDEDCSNTD